MLRWYLWWFRLALAEFRKNALLQKKKHKIKENYYSKSVALHHSCFAYTVQKSNWLKIINMMRTIQIPDRTQNTLEYFVDGVFASNNSWHLLLLLQSVIYSDKYFPKTGWKNWKQISRLYIYVHSSTLCIMCMPYAWVYNNPFCICIDQNNLNRIQNVIDLKD